MKNARGALVVAAALLAGSLFSATVFAATKDDLSCEHGNRKADCIFCRLQDQVNTATAKSDPTGNSTDKKDKKEKETDSYVSLIKDSALEPAQEGTLDEAQADTKNDKNVASDKAGAPEEEKEELQSDEDEKQSYLGYLTVSATVSGKEASEEQEFTFTVTLDDTQIDGIYDGMTFDHGVSVFTMNPGESKTTYIPEKINYTVEESGSDGYLVSVIDPDNYKKKSDSSEGTIIANAIRAVSFNNHKDETGTLEICAAVSGSRSDPDKEFTYTVILDDFRINGTYGDMSFDHGVSVFTMKGGESRLADLPSSIEYTIVEDDCEDYAVTINNRYSERADGIITAGTTRKVNFHNYK